MKDLSAKPANLNGKHRKLADHLLNAHIKESSYSKLPTYHYDQQRKGTTCRSCHSFDISCGGRKITCTICGTEEDIESAVLRSIEELRLLFPDMKITTNLVYDWCKLDDQKRKIRRILSKNYKIMGHGKYSFYV